MSEAPAVAIRPPQHPPCTVRAACKYVVPLWRAVQLGHTTHTLNPVPRGCAGIPWPPTLLLSCNSCAEGAMQQSCRQRTSCARWHALALPTSTPFPAAGAIPPRVALLRRNSTMLQTSSCNALSVLSHNDLAAVNAIAAAGAILPLAALLSSSSSMVQEVAVAMLRNLACTSVNKQAIAAAGAIPLLVALLSSSNADVQKLAPWALSNLARKHFANQQAIAAAGAIPLMVALLGSSDCEVQENAAGALCNLVCNDAAIQGAIAAAGAIPPLVALLANESLSLVAQAIVALNNLVYNNAANQAAIAAAGAIPPLVKLLRSQVVFQRTTLQQLAAGVLRHRLPPPARAQGGEAVCC